MFTHGRRARQTQLWILCREFSDQLWQIFTGMYANAKKHGQYFDVCYPILSHCFHHIWETGRAQLQVGARHIPIGHRGTYGCGKSLKRITPKRVAGAVGK